MPQSANIMIVEDDSVIAADIEETLKRQGYQVPGVFESGEDALARVAEIRPDLVLMDIFLQGEMDGIETAQQLIAAHGIPVIYLTGNASDAILERAKLTEPYGYVLKPFSELELKIAVEISLYRRSVAQREITVCNWTEESVDIAALSPERLEMVNNLSQVEPFDKLPDAALASVSGNCSSTEVKAGAVLAFEGDEDVSGFIVTQGRVAVIQTSESGKELIVDLLSPGDPLGIIATLEQTPYPFTARAQVDSTILWVDRRCVIGVLDKYPDVCHELMRSTFERLRKSHSFSRLLAHELVETRVLSVLLAFVSRFGVKEKEKSTYSLKLSRQELASLTGTSPETVSRVLSPLERAQIIDLSKHGIVILNDISEIERRVVH